MTEELEDYNFAEDDFDFGNQELTFKQKIWRWVRGSIALLAVIGIIYISGIYQLFFYQRTPTTIKQQPITSILNQATIRLPLNIYILQGDGAGSERESNDIQGLVVNASNIWQQADIELNINNIETLEVDEAGFDLFAREPYSFITNLDNLDEQVINIFLVDTLGGYNGVAYTGIESIALADYTAGFDFRTLAHEIGHVLGLDHIKADKGQLMYQGASGIELTDEEIVKARATAAEFR